MAPNPELLGIVLSTLVQQLGGTVEIPLSQIDDGTTVKLELEFDQDAGVARLTTTVLPLPPGISNVRLIH